MRDSVLDILERICGDDIVRTEPDINLLEEDLMESFDYIDLIMDLYDTFGVQISPSEFTQEEMDTPNKIIAIVRIKLKEAETKKDGEA